MLFNRRLSHSDVVTKMPWDTAITGLALLLVAASLSGCITGGSTPVAAPPDLTKVFPEDLKKVHNLGPTGLEGWMHVEYHKLAPGDLTRAPQTGDARQIYITKVDNGSPADGVIEVGDVVLGIGSRLFAEDPRIALAEAINEAEKGGNGGALKLLCWRPDEPEKEGAKERGTGSADVRELQLKVLGTYSDTAPYNCRKSEVILKQTVDLMLADRGKMSRKLDLPYLALLATGEEAHFELAKQHILAAVESVPEPSIEAVEKAHGWNIGYRLILFCEYYLMTGDETVLPAIRNTAITLSMGQSVAGVWGHKMANPSYNDGRLHARLSGYAALNQPSLTCFMGLVLAQKCGVKHPELTAAIDKANVYFRHHVGRGAIPYGHGPPREFLQTNNGTSGSAALAFNIKNDKKAAGFFARMSAGAQPKLETGHTGHFFNTMWTGLGANIAGPEAYAEFFKRWTWLRTLTRRWDGHFVYQSAGGGSFNYRGLSADAAMILHYALPKRQLLITGRDQDQSLWLAKDEAVAAASVWEIDYQHATDVELVELLGHSIPMVRGFAANQLASRGDRNLDPLQRLLRGTNNEKIGACNAFAGMKEMAAPALGELMRIVKDEGEDLWIRSRAAQAVASTGEAGHGSVGELLKLLVVDRPDDPRRDFERYLAPIVVSMVTHQDFDYTAHKDFIYPAALKLMDHPHVHARRYGMSMVNNVSLEEFHLFADSIVKAILNNDPDYTSYSGDRPRQTGLAILSRLNIEDGIPLAIDTIEPGIWGQKYRITSPGGRLALLKGYGTNVKPYIPQLRQVMGDKAEDTIKEIESSTVVRNLISLKDAKQGGSTKQD